MCNDIYQKLKDSPLFHFSLHSKELFHSNFIVWLGEDPELRLILKKVILALGIEESEFDSWGENFEVVREKNHMDLIIKSKITDKSFSHKKEKWYVVIENKVKSIPTTKQLETYSNEIKSHSIDPDSVKKILLCFGELNKEMYHNWENVNYSKILTALNGELDSVENVYKKEIINDYIEMGNALIDIMKLYKVDDDSKFLVSSNDNLKKLRIDDLVQKWRTAQILDILNSKENSTASMGYTNKEPLIQDFINMGRGIKMGIQIQGSQYRRVIIGKIKREDIASKSHGFLCDSRETFQRHMINRYGNVFENKESRKNQKDCCSYKTNQKGITFWYRYVTINGDATVSQVLNCFKEDLKYLNNLKSNKFFRIKD